MYFSINGYWKDDNVSFEGYIVREFDDVLEDEPNEDGLTDNDIFYYGLSELEIQASIANAGIEEDVLEFVITSYKIYTP